MRLSRRTGWASATACLLIACARGATEDPGEDSVEIQGTSPDASTHIPKRDASFTSADAEIPDATRPGDGPKTCTDTCPAGAARCDGVQISSCLSGSSGCLEWSPPVACGTGQVCSGDTCADTCTNVCTDRTTRCAGPRGQQVCGIQSSGCFDWGSIANCATNQSCQGGACATCNTSASCGPTCSPCGGTTSKCFASGATSKCVACISSTDCSPGSTCNPTSHTCDAVSGTCSGTIVDWNWNTGTGPTPVATIGTSWSVGTATSGPGDGLRWLATNPGGNYADGVNDSARLPAIDLSAYQTCKIRVTSEIWRNSEQFGVNYDGGNVQYTTDPTATSGWSVLDGSGMGYDGTLTDCVGSCNVAGQNVWTGSNNPKSKTGIFVSSAPLGKSLSLRFTFHSDSSNSRGPLPGLYVRRVWVEAVP